MTRSFPAECWSADGSTKAIVWIKKFFNPLEGELLFDAEGNQYRKRVGAGSGVELIEEEPTED